MSYFNRTGQSISVQIKKDCGGGMPKRQIKKIKKSYEEVLKWDEAAHPRGPDGKFTAGSGGDDRTGESMGPKDENTQLAEMEEEDERAYTVHSIHTQAAKTLGWSDKDVKSVGLAGLRDLVKDKNPRLASTISAAIRNGWHITTPTADMSWLGDPPTKEQSAAYEKKRQRVLDDRTGEDMYDLGQKQPKEPWTPEKEAKWSEFMKTLGKPKSPASEPRYDKSKASHKRPFDAY